MTNEERSTNDEKSTANRRTVLGTTATTLSIGVGGCLSSSSDDPSLPSDMTIETWYGHDEILSDGLTLGPDSGTRRQHHTVLADREDIDEKIVDEYADHEFVSETDFSESSLVIVQYRLQSDPELVLDEIERTDYGLAVTFSIDYPANYGDDSIVHTFVIRITDDEADVPGEVRVEIDGEEYA